MRTTFADAVAALPESAQRRLSGLASMADVGPDDPVAFAGLVRRGGERGLLVVTDRQLVFAAETGGVADATPLESLTLAVPRPSLLVVAPGTGGRVQDEFRPQQPGTFAQVAWPEALAAAHPDARPRTPDRDLRGILLAVLVLLLVVAAGVAATLLLA